MSSLDFYHLGSISREPENPEAPETWESHLGASLELGNGTQLILVFPEFLEPQVYLEVANTLASRLSTSGGVGAPQMIPRQELNQVIAQSRLELWTHRYFGNVIRLWVAIR